MITDPAVVKETVGERARGALGEIQRESATVHYLARREPIRANVSPVLLDVTAGTRASSGWTMFAAGAACAALILTALYFSL